MVALLSALLPTGSVPGAALQAVGVATTARANAGTWLAGAGSPVAAIGEGAAISGAMGAGGVLGAAMPDTKTPDRDLG